MSYKNIKNKGQNFIELMQEIESIHKTGKMGVLLSIDLNQIRDNQDNYSTSFYNHYGASNHYGLKALDEKDKLDFFYYFYQYPDFKKMLNNFVGKINIKNVDFMENGKLIYETQFLKDLKRYFKFYSFELFLEKGLDFMILDNEPSHLKKFIEISIQKSTDKMELLTKIKDFFENNVKDTKQYEYLWSGLDYVEDENLLKTEKKIDKRCFQIKEQHLNVLLKNYKINKEDLVQSLSKLLRNYQEQIPTIFLNLDYNFKLTIESENTIEESNIKKINKFLLFSLKEIIPQGIHKRYHDLQIKIDEFAIMNTLEQAGLSEVKKSVKKL